MRILITGATGFIGRNYLLRCLGRGWRVVAPVRDELKLRQQLAAEGLEAEQVQVLPADRIASWGDLRGLDAAVLTAGVLFEREPERYLRVNVEWTGAVLAALPERCPVVVLSSQSAGGPCPRGASSRTERDPDVPTSWYGESKLRMERMIRRDFAGRPLAILRPCMVFGPRDNATLQLFRMVRSPVWLKPGMKPKFLSFLACEDLLDAIDLALERSQLLNEESYYVASRRVVSDGELVRAAAQSVGARGILLSLPHGVVRCVSAIVDGVAMLRASFPSLTRDRVREMLEERWVVNPSAFENLTGWYARRTLAQALEEAAAYARGRGQL